MHKLCKTFAQLCFVFVFYFHFNRAGQQAAHQVKSQLAEKALQAAKAAEGKRILLK